MPAGKVRAVQGRLWRVWRSGHPGGSGGSGSGSQRIDTRHDTDSGDDSVNN